MEYDNTIIEKLIAIVSKSKETKVEDAARLLGTERETIMKIGNILDQHDIVKISYNIVGEPVFRAGPNINKKAEDEAEPAKIENKPFIPENAPKERPCAVRPFGVVIARNDMARDTQPGKQRFGQKILLLKTARRDIPGNNHETQPRL